MRDPLSLTDFYPTADALQGRTIVDAYAIRDSELGQYASVHLLLDEGRLRIEIDIDLDEIKVIFDVDASGSLVPEVGLTLDRAKLARLVGLQIGWSWACYNSQGYRDTLMLGVPGIIPNVIFHAIASGVRVGFTDLD